MEADTPENIKKTLELIRSLGVKPGIVVKPKTPAEALAPYIDKVDMILVMTVEPGFGGQSLMSHCVEKIAHIRAEADRQGNKALRIAVDGGVNEANCASVAAAGANILVAGSAVFGQEDMTSAFAKLSADVAKY